MAADRTLPGNAKRPSKGRGHAVRSRWVPIAIALASISTSGACFDPPAIEPGVIHARFDPEAGVIPRPNDILRDTTAGRLAIPAEPEDLEGKTAAEIALIHELNTRDAWPSRTAAELSFTGAIDPSSVNDRSVRVFAVMNDGIREESLTAEMADPVRNDRLAIAPPAEGWRRGGRYFVAALGGERGLRGTNGEPVVADAAFWFLRTRESLRDHVAAIPGSTKEERAAKAERLEKIRLGLQPYFEHLEALGLAREEVVALWSYTITRSPEVLMDKDSGHMPLPSDFLRNPASGLIELPIRDTDTPLQQEMKHALSAFDGFGLSSDLRFELSGPISASTLTSTAVRLFAIDAARAEARSIAVELSASNGDTSITVSLPNGPLAPGTDHVLVLTTELKGSDGISVEPMMPGVLAMLDVPLLEDGRSTIASVSTESAAKVEPVREGVARAMPLLEARGLPRARIAAIWPFRTMSIAEPMRAARDAAGALGLDPNPSNLVERSALQSVGDFPMAAVTLFRIERVVHGTITVPDYLDPVTRKRWADGHYEPRQVPFTMTIPRGASESEPLRTVIFGHGLTAERRFVLTVADALAAEGLAAIAIDFPYHGERTLCAWAGPTCLANPLSQEGELICPAACEGGSSCAPDGQCVDSGGRGNHLARWPLLGFPQASGFAFLEMENLMGMRDHFLQAITDLAALHRSLGQGDWRAAIGHDIAPDVGYVGQSLGGILGAIYAAVEPELRRVVLNVPGADLVELFRESTTFSPQFEAFLVREDIEVGTEAHTQLLNVARWVADSFDPQSFARYLLREPFEPNTSVHDRTILIQMATLDTVIGNEQTELLQRLGGVPRKDYIAEHAFITIPIEPAYLPGVRDVAGVLAHATLP